MLCSDKFQYFSINDFIAVKNKVLNWTKQFSTFCFLDNHEYPSEMQDVKCLLAVGNKQSISLSQPNHLQELNEFIHERPRWIFGHIGYELCHAMFGLSSSHIDRVGFSDSFFFEPQIVIGINGTTIMIDAENPIAVFNEINATSNLISEATVNAHIQQRMQKDEYVQTIQKLQQHIQRGDCYEINFCQEFFAENVSIDGVAVYRKLSAVSPNPFSALYRVNDQWLICASPERFLRKKGHKLFSQPIKGTSARNLTSRAADSKSKEELLQSPKEKAENVMVVDLVRNDLSKICKEGTVNVDELFAVHSFPQVHQLISTISAELEENILFADIITAMFPMGSMTGAPKKSVMQLIEKHEKVRRGIFSGALGYFSPDGDFDFNVVIRSIMYNARMNYLSFQAGSGITFYSNAADEWDECVLKAAAIREVLANR